MHNIYKIAATTIITFVLTSCGFMADKVHAKLDNEYFTAVFYESTCSSEKVKSLLPESQVKELGDTLKNGKVHLKMVNEDREFCYVIMGTDGLGGEMAAIIDEKGSTPLLVIGGKPPVAKDPNTKEI